MQDAPQAEGTSNTEGDPAEQEVAHASTLAENVAAGSNSIEK
jgi:hypothetical protein